MKWNVNIQNDWKCGLSLLTYRDCIVNSSVPGMKIHVCYWHWGLCSVCMREFVCCKGNHCIYEEPFAERRLFVVCLFILKAIQSCFGVETYLRIELVLRIFVGKAIFKSPFAVNTSPFLSIFSSWFMDACIVNWVDFIFNSLTSNFSTATWAQENKQMN